MALQRLILQLSTLLRSGLRYGESKRTWKSFRQPGSVDSDQAMLVIGGLSSNGASVNRTLARELSRGEVLTLSRNLYGHTGRFSDFSRSRVWHWIADALISLRKLVSRFRKNDLVLIGHSTGGLVILAILILFRIAPRWLMRGINNAQGITLRGVLIFPPFSLKRRLDARLLWIVAIMYYLVCPAAFLLLAFSGPWMWPLSLLAYACHVYFVPKISVPSGDERARQPEKKRKWAVVSESLFLASLCIYFVSAPPLIAVLAHVGPSLWAITAFWIFIASLIAPIFLIPRKTPDVALESEHADSCDLRDHLGYRWLPVITVANLQVLQFVLQYLLRFCQSRLLVIEGGKDEVVVVERTWIEALGAHAELLHLADFPHSDLNRQQQTELASIIRNWIVDSCPEKSRLANLTEL